MIYNISSYHNGLGDCLQFSSFPEQLAELGHTVNLYEGPDVLKYRNPAIKDFVWGYNPYISKEVSKENWNFGDIPGVEYKNTTGHFIKNWARAFNLPEIDILPKIYYKPNKIEDLLNVGIIELSGISMKNEYISKDVVLNVRRIMKLYPTIEFKILVNANQSNPIEMSNISKIITYDLEGISDIINSCKVFISLSSGLHSLASAISRFDNNFTQYCVLPESKYSFFMRSLLFMYPNVIYTT